MQLVSVLPRSRLCEDGANAGSLVAKARLHPSYLHSCSWAVSPIAPRPLSEQSSYISIRVVQTEDTFKGLGSRIEELKDQSNT
jgi:hypothetical protein